MPALTSNERQDSDSTGLVYNSQKVQAEQCQTPIQVFAGNFVAIIGDITWTPALVAMQLRQNQIPLRHGRSFQHRVVAYLGGIDTFWLFYPTGEAMYNIGF